MANRAPKAEVEYRVMLFAEAIASGLASRQDLLRLSATNGWGLQARQIDNYITKALEVFKQRGIETIDIARHKRIKQLEHLLQLNYAKCDYTECRHAIKALADIEHSTIQIC